MPASQLGGNVQERVASHEKVRSDMMMRQAMYHGLNQSMNQPSYMPPPVPMPGQFSTSLAWHIYHL